MLFGENPTTSSECDITKNMNKGYFLKEKKGCSHYLHVICHPGVDSGFPFCLNSSTESACQAYNQGLSFI